MEMPNWDSCIETLVKDISSAIDTFALSHPKDICSCAAFTSDYGNGTTVLSIDTVSNAIEQAKTHQSWVLQEQERMFRRPSQRRWKNAMYYVSNQSMRLVDYSPSTGYFQYQGVAQVVFPEWERILRSDGFDRYDEFHGEVIILYWNMINQLVDLKAFHPLRMASPFRVGLEFVDDTTGFIVMRILNWPRT